VIQREWCAATGDALLVKNRYNEIQIGLPIKDLLAPLSPLVEKEISHE
jgi:hypothetical protein